MQRWISVLLLCTLAACGEDATSLDDVTVEPCSGRCDGLQLTIDSVRFRLPAGQSVVYSGDSATLSIWISNRGTVASDSATQIDAYDRLNSGGWTRVPTIAPGKGIRVDMPIGFPQFSRSARTRDSLVVELFRSGPEVPHEYQFLDERLTPAFAFAPTTMRLRGVPAILKYPSRLPFELVVTNPSPRAIAADSIWICAFDYDYCVLDRTRITMPAVGARDSVVIPVEVELARDPARYDRMAGIDFRLCRNSPTFCTAVPIDLIPDFESFCAVRRLQPGETNGTSIGRGCGVGWMSDRVDLASFEATAGTTYRITPLTPNVYLWVRASDGGSVAVEQDYSTGQYTIRPVTTGRYYVGIGTSGSYTLLLETVP